MTTNDQAEGAAKTKAPMRTNRGGSILPVTTPHKRGSTRTLRVDTGLSVDN